MRPSPDSLGTLTTPGPVGRPSTADRIGYGAVHLNVVALERSLPFWLDAVGLQLIDSTPRQATLGVGDGPLVVLHAGAQSGVQRGAAGLYHVALHVADEAEFARALARLSLAHVRQSPTDHIFSKATYTFDPDGIMLELTLETPERYGGFEPAPGGFVFRDSEGRARNPTEPLDLDVALAPLGDRDPREPLGRGARVGHVHLHVPDLAAAYAFYRDVIGFEEHAYMTSIGMADLSAGGTFPHRLALNSWNGETARQPEPGSAGLDHFELLLADRDELAALEARAQDTRRPQPTGARDGTVALVDPAGTALRVSARSSNR
jgi:catechol 2,3-dioxygenase